MLSLDLGVADAISTLINIALAVITYLLQRQRRARLVYGLRPPADPAQPRQRELVIGVVAPSDVALGTNIVEIRMSHPVGGLPLQGADGQGWQATLTGEKKIVLAGAQTPANLVLQNDRNLSLPLEIDLVAQAEAVTVLPDVQPVSLERIRKRAWIGTGVAALATPALVWFGLHISINFVEDWAPFAGRLVIGLALVPVVVGYLQARLLSRF